MVKSFVREEQEKAKFAQRSDRLRSMAERAFGFVVLFMPVMMILMGGTITAVLWIGGHYVWEGTLLSGDLIAFFTYVSEILMSLMMVSVVLMMLTRAIACGKRIVEVLEEKPRITDEQADPALKVPHIGWNAMEIVPGRETDPLFKYVKNGEYVYYVHSYYAKNCAASTLATSEYSIPVTGAVRQGLVYGTQFHPEKSGDTGLRLLKAFAEL